MAKVDLTTLAKAMNQLERGYTLLNADSTKNNQDLHEHMVAACIQEFEFTFEMSIKMLVKYLKEFESEAIINRLPYRELMRVAAQRMLIDDPKEWFDFREKRNITSHTYDKEKADEVLAIIPAFVQSVKKLVEGFKQYELERR